MTTSPPTPPTPSPPAPFHCRWALLSLSSISHVFITDLLLPRPSTSPPAITHSIACLSSTRPPSTLRPLLSSPPLSLPNAATLPIYPSWRTLLTTAAFDAVYISTPHPLHYAQAALALRHGRAVLLEKPACMTAPQYAALAALARAHGGLLMEALWTRYLPAVGALRALLPRLGAVRRVWADFSFPIVGPGMDPASRFLDKAQGAGALLDQGVYALTWVDEVLGEAEVLFADSMPVEGTAVDDLNTVILARPAHDGTPRAVAIVTTSMTLPGSSAPPFYARLAARKPAPAVRVEGTRGSVAVAFPPIRPQELRVVWYGGEEEGEREEVVSAPVERGWGLWYQADVLAGRVREREGRRERGEGVEGEVVGGEGTARVLRWLDAAREMAGVRYDPELESLEEGEEGI